MTTDASADPYETVLADLRAKRDQITNAIAALESLRPTGAVSAPSVRPVHNPVLPQPFDPRPTSDEFVGVTIVDGAKALLARRGKPLGNLDIATAFLAGGMNLNSADPTNTIGSVITRRFNQVGDIVRVGRGLWGLPEWYPGRTFERKSVGKGPAAIPAEADAGMRNAPEAASLSAVATSVPMSAPRGHAYGVDDTDMN